MSDVPNDGGVGYDLAALARVSGVPARTVRYYRQIGLLDPPVRSGRKAIYAADQLPRLQLIASLRERGLALDAIARVLDVEGGTERAGLGDLLALGDDLRAPWVDDRSATLDEEAVLSTFGTTVPDALERLEAYGVIYRRPGSGPVRYDVPSMALLRLAGRMVDAGVAPDLADEAYALLLSHLGALAGDLVRLFTSRVGDGFAGSGHPDELREGVDELRRLSLAAVQLIFAREVEQAIATFVERGGLFEVDRRVHDAGESHGEGVPPPR